MLFINGGGRIKIRGGGFSYSGVGLFQHLKTLFEKAGRVDGRWDTECLIINNYRLVNGTSRG